MKNNNSLCILIPTYNEAESIIELLTEIKNYIHIDNYEVIVIDDNSPDGTSKIVNDFSKIPGNNFVRCITRHWSKGLSSAVVEGIASTAKDIICVIDGDSQHDPKDISKMHNIFINNEFDLIVGSRFLDSEISESLSKERNWLSNTGIKICNYISSYKINDPLSGFFMTNRHTIDPYLERLYKPGFKILFDFLMIKPGLRVKDFQINFRNRTKGQSKIDFSILMSLPGQIIENKSNGLISSLFVMFACVGSIGVLVHLGSLALMLFLGVNFYFSNIIGTLLAMTSNYLLNNLITFFNIHNTFAKKIKGYIKYLLMNSISILANIGIASNFYLRDYSEITSALIGIFAGLLLNYMLSRNLVFNK